MDMTPVPEVNGASPMTNPDAAAMALTGDTATDLANIAKELGVSVDASGNTTPIQATAQPAQVTPVTQPQAAEQPKTETAVPAKFQNPDGTVNEQRLEKSTQSIDEAIARYRVKEREFQQLQNKVNNPIAVPQVQVQPAQVQPTQLTAFEVQIANDLLAESTAAGEPMKQAHAIAQARVIAKGLEAKYSAEMDATSDLRRRLEDNERSRELQGMIDGDPSLMSAEMVDKLWQVRQDNPYLNQAKEPWKAAYTFFKGSQTHGGQVQTPNPTGQTAKAPPTPVGPVSRVQQTVNLENVADIKTLTDAQLEAMTRQHFPGLRAR